MPSSSRTYKLRVNLALGLAAIAAFSSVGGPALAADGATTLARAAGLVDGKNVKKNSISGAQIKDGSIATKDLANGAVTAPKLSREVTALLAKAATPGPAGPRGLAGVAGLNGDKGDKGDKGDNGAPGTGGVPGGPAGGALSGTYPSPGLADNAVTDAKLASDSVGLAELKINSVNQAIIVDGAVGSADIGDGTITGADVSDNTLAAVDLATNSVAADELAQNSVGLSELQIGSVNQAILDDGAVTAPKIAAGAAAANVWSAPAPAGTMAVGGFFDQGTGAGLGYLASEIDYPFPLNGPPYAVVVPAGRGPAPADPDCRGTVANPTAQPGRLCIYDNSLAVTAPFVVDPAGGSGAGAHGAALTSAFVNPASSNYHLMQGTWALNAPA